MSDVPDKNEFKQHITESEILDPEGVHHEFVSGMHGRKLDFDAIPTDNDLFLEWVAIVAQAVRELYPDVPLDKLVLLSVAGGTNRLVGPVAKLLGGGVHALLTEKVSPKAVKLTAEAEKMITKLQPDLVLAVEDVGTRGTTSASAVVAARAAGATRVEALNTWQRREQLEELEAIDAVYHSIINDVLPTLSPEECRASGYCAQGWQYIEHA
jgi:phosphoribosylpyrophosphate synthetase